MGACLYSKMVKDACQTTCQRVVYEGEDTNLNGGSGMIKSNEVSLLMKFRSMEIEEYVKSLGVRLDGKLSMSDFIAATVSSCNIKLRNLYGCPYEYHYLRNLIPSGKLYTTLQNLQLFV